MIVMTPKSLLRHSRCVSGLEDFTKGKFQEVIDDPDFEKQPEKAKRVLLCSGKVYYDLLERKEKEEIKDIAIVRLEQLYPLPETQLQEILDRYKKAEFYWVQEEPKNMGAWTYILRWPESCKRFNLVSRKASASPATGYHKVHEREQNALVEEALDLNNS